MNSVSEQESLDSIRPVCWQDGVLQLLDQRRLPEEEVYLRFDSCEAVADAIRDMVVRGAPAIGITAAYGVALAVRESKNRQADITKKLDYLARARPTAVNLFWAIERMRPLLEQPFER